MAVSDYDPIIDAAAQEWDVDPNWARAVMHQESGGKSVDAQGRPIRSSAGAGGLMQIMPRTAAGLGIQNVDDPVENIWGGVKYLAQMRDQFHGNVPLATAAYNAGPDRVAAYIAGQQPLPTETAAYLPKVAGNYQRFAGQYPARAASPAAKGPLAALPAAAPAQPGAMSDNDFLTRVAGPQAQAETVAPSVRSDDEFLKRAASGGNVSTVPQPVAAPHLEGEAYYAGMPGAGADETTKFGNAVMEGAARGFGPVTAENPLGFSPASEGELRTLGIYGPKPGTGTPLQLLNEGVLNPLASASGLVGRLGRAAVGAYQGGASLFSRDLAALPEAFPTGIHGLKALPTAAMETNPLIARPLSRAGPLEPDIAPGSAVQAPAISVPAAAAPPLAAPVPVLTSSPAFDALRGGATIPNLLASPGPAVFDPLRGPTSLPANPPAAPIPQPPSVPSIAGTVSVGPAPQSLGAAATAAGLSNMTPAEALASRSTGEMQRVLEPARQGIDTTIYVPGTKPTEAEVSGSPKVAAEQKFNRSQNPDPHIEQEQANNAARVEYYDQTAGTPTQVQRLKEARGEQATQDLEAAFGNKGAADVKPVIDTINGILSDPRLGERDAVVDFVKPYLAKLKNVDGSLKDDPEALYGIRENITDQLAKNGDPKNAGARTVRRQLMQVKGSLDDAIEQAAPGYRQYLDNFSEASRPIDAMEYLQEMRPSLTNAQGTMAPAAFDRFMKNTVTDRAEGPGYGHNSGAVSLTDDQMDVLHNLHSDLKRFQNINLSNPRGSDTNMMGQIASAGGKIALHAAANAISPVLGSIGVRMGENALQSRRIAKTTERVLNPNPLKYPPPQGP